MTRESPVNLKELERLVTIKDVSDLTGFATSSLYTMRHEGRGPKGYRIGGRVRYRLSDVLAWIEEHADEPRQ